MGKKGGGAKRFYLDSLEITTRRPYGPGGRDMQGGNARRYRPALFFSSSSSRPFNRKGSALTCG
jgi:hypothetical protein